MAAHSSLVADSYAIHAIVVAYGLAFVPFYFKVIMMIRATKGKGLDYSMPRLNVPRTLSSKIITPETADLAERAQYAHTNALEGFPFFAAAMLAGTLVGLPAEELNTAATRYLVSRVFYTVFYVGNTRRVFGIGVARSVCWAFGLLVTGRVIWRAGSLL